MSISRRIASSLWRSPLCIALTGIFSPYLFTIAFILISSMQRWSIRGAGNIDGLISGTLIIGTFGIFYATPYALILGIFVEFPKSLWLLKQNGDGRKIHWTVSILAAQLIVFGSLMLIDGPKILDSPDYYETIAVCALAAGIGGICSAMFWWRFFVVPLRRARAA